MMKAGKRTQKPAVGSKVRLPERWRIGRRCGISPRAFRKQSSNLHRVCCFGDSVDRKMTATKIGTVPTCVGSSGTWPLLRLFRLVSQVRLV